MSAPAGRRERKKQLTRQAISDVATTLFLERGFEAVTIAEIAAAADVAVQTVFNHFATKEDLFFDDLGWVTGPAEAIRAAPDAAPADVLEAGYRAAIERRRSLGYLPTAERYWRTIEASPALRARRARNADEMQERLAAALAGDDPPAWRHRLFAARYAAVLRVVDDELVRLVDEQGPDPGLEALDAVITEAFATLR